MSAPRPVASATSAAPDLPAQARAKSAAGAAAFVRVYDERLNLAFPTSDGRGHR